MTTLALLFTCLVLLWNSVAISDSDVKSYSQDTSDVCTATYDSHTKVMISCNHHEMYEIELSIEETDSDCDTDENCSILITKISDNGNTMLPTMVSTTDKNQMEQTSTRAVSNSFDENKRGNASLTSDLVAIYSLGAAVGLLVLLLVATITGWIWTYCMMKRREKMLITGRNNAIIDKIDNPNYGTGDQISLNQNPQLAPEHDTIPPHLRQEHGYDFLNMELPNSVPNERNEQRNTTKSYSSNANPLMHKPLQIEEEMREVHSSADIVTPKQEDHMENDWNEEEYSENDTGLPSSMDVAIRDNQRKKNTTQGGSYEEREGIMKISEIESGLEHVYFQLENGEKEQEEMLTKKLSALPYEEFVPAK